MGVEKDDDDRDVVDHFLFLLPLRMSFSNQFIRGCFRLIIDVEWQHHLANLLIA